MNHTGVPALSVVIGVDKLKKKNTLNNEITKWLPFLLLSSTVQEIREKLFPGVKCRENLFARNSKNPKSAKLNSRENFMPQGIPDALSYDSGQILLFLRPTQRIKCN